MIILMTYILYIIIYVDIIYYIYTNTYMMILMT